MVSVVGEQTSKSWLHNPSITPEQTFVPDGEEPAYTLKPFVRIMKRSTVTLTTYQMEVRLSKRKPKPWDALLIEDNFWPTSLGLLYKLAWQSPVDGCRLLYSKDNLVYNFSLKEPSELPLYCVLEKCTHPTPVIDTGNTNRRDILDTGEKFCSNLFGCIGPMLLVLISCRSMLSARKWLRFLIITQADVFQQSGVTFALDISVLHALRHRATGFSALWEKRPVCGFFWKTPPR